MFKHMITFAAVVGFVLALAPAAQAATILDTDPLAMALGLTEGAIFRMVFVTSTTTKAESKEIGDYNTFVNNVANNLAGNSGSIVAAYGWTWSVIGSTASMDAIENTGTQWTTAAPGFPIYLVGGYTDRVADTYQDIWDRSIKRSINRHQTGALREGVDMVVFTGTDPYGYRESGSLLGDALPLCGYVGILGEGWTHYCDRWYYDASSLYAMSEPIRVIPEPATMALMGLGGLGMLLGRRRVRG